MAHVEHTGRGFERERRDSKRDSEHGRDRGADGRRDGADSRDGRDG